MIISWKQFLVFHITSSNAETLMSSLYQGPNSIYVNSFWVPVLSTVGFHVERDLQIVCEHF